MPTIQQDILEAFLQSLATSDGFDEEMVTAMRKLFASKKKIKADDLVKVLSGESKEDLP